MQLTISPVATVPTACGIETTKIATNCCFFIIVATVPTACGMQRRVRGSRGVKRRWGPHISSPWLKGRENKGDEVTVLTACGIETLQTTQHTYWVFAPCCNSTYRLRYWNHKSSNKKRKRKVQLVATVPTACGIETKVKVRNASNFKLQQCLPLAVLKLWMFCYF